MDLLSYSDLSLLHSSRRKNQVHGDRPLFVFPCGGNEGGRLLYSGSVEGLMKLDTPTSRALKKFL